MKLTRITTLAAAVCLPLLAAPVAFADQVVGTVMPGTAGTNCGHFVLVPYDDPTHPIKAAIQFVGGVGAAAQWASVLFLGGHTATVDFTGASSSACTNDGSLLIDAIGPS